MNKEIHNNIKEIELDLKIKNYQLLNIRHLNEELYLIKNIEQLFDVIEFTCVGFFQFKPIVLYFDSSKIAFTCSKKKNDNISNLVSSPELLVYFNKNKGYSILDELSKIDKTNSKIYSHHKDLKIKYCFPIFFKNKLKGIFFFGEKMSKLPIKNSDIELLSITGQISVSAKENIMLVQNLLNKNIELNQSLEKQKQLYQKLNDVYEELKSIDKLKVTFITLITHELNTPLTIIKSYIEALNSGMVAETEKETIKEFYDAIESNANELIKIVKSIITLTKLQNNQLKFNYSEQNICDLINICIDDIKSKIIEKKIFIEPIYNEIKSIICDETLIRQVIMIILDNAIKFSEDSGKIVIECLNDKYGVIVSIRDFGKGIENEIEKNLFERFSQAESILHHSQGLGISLAIAKMIIEQGHKGKIWIEKCQGKGAEFRFFIPYKIK